MIIDSDKHNEKVQEYIIEPQLILLIPHKLI